MTNRLQLLQRLQQVLAFGDRPLRAHLRVADDALPIDDERRTRVHPTLIIEDAVRLAHCAVRPEVGQQRERQAAELLGPGLQRRNRIGAQLQDLYVLLLELVVVRTEPEDLILSPAGEGERHESDDRLAALEPVQGERLVQVRGKREIGCLRSWLQRWHASSFSIRGLIDLGRLTRC
jgi:hypothetical protein